MKRILLAAICFIFVLGATCFADDVVNLGGTGDDLSGKTVDVTEVKNTPYYHYVNERFGFAIDIPRSIDQATETSTKDGCTFYSSKENISVVIYGAENRMNMNLQELFNIDMVSNNSPTLSYKQFGNDWYGIAWENGKMTYYKKVISHGAYYNSFGFTYPTAQKAKYQPIIQHMNSTFLPVFNLNAK